MKVRKREEQEFHNKLRNERLKEELNKYKFLTSNKKFYAIDRSNRKFCDNWLKTRCKNKKVLDYCCGDGYYSFTAARNGAEVIGIDISNVSIENCQKRAALERFEKTTTFLVMDAEELKFDNDSFDIIVVSGVLHHLDLKKAFAELSRVLKPDGKIICMEPLKHNPVIHFYRKMTPHLRTQYEFEHILKKSDLGMAKLYFNGIETRFFHLATMGAIPFHNFPVFYSILSMLEAVDKILCKIPIIKWLAWMAVFILSNPIKSTPQVIKAP